MVCKTLDSSTNADARPINTNLNCQVRSHAVAVLQQKDDDELMYYLLQLVQALRFEAADLSRLARFLVTRATSNPAFATFLHWYLFTEWEDPTFGARASCVHAALVDALMASPHGEAVWEAIRRQTDMMSQLAYIVKDVKVRHVLGREVAVSAAYRPQQLSQTPLTHLLPPNFFAQPQMARLKAARATERLREMLSASGPCEELTTVRVPLPLNPNMLLEGLVAAECSCFKSAQLPVKLAYRVSPRPIDWASPMPLVPLARVALVGSGDHSAGGAAAAAAGVPAAASGGGSSSVAVPLAAARASAVAQALQLPQSCQTALTVSESDPSSLRVVVIYKKGDDLRQDQFVLQVSGCTCVCWCRSTLWFASIAIHDHIVDAFPRLFTQSQMISLMDRLLKRENLDLRLTPYRVLPTGSDDGLVEFVPSVPLSRLLAEHRSIHRFLLAHGQGDPSGELLGHPLVCRPLQQRVKETRQCRPIDRASMLIHFIQVPSACAARRWRRSCAAAPATAS